MGVQRTIALVVVVAFVTGAGSVVGAAGAPSQEAPTCEFPVTATDATGTAVTIEEEPESVVTLNPSAAQIMWEIGAKEKVSGVTKHAMNLDGAAEKVNISSESGTITHERVVDTEPDLVLAPLSTVTTPEDVEQLRNAGLTVYAYPTADSLVEIRNRTRLTGEFVGECEGASETVDWMDQQIETVEDAVDDEPAPDVLYTFFGFTAGEQTHIHEILETAGGHNIATEMGIDEYAELNQEAVLDADPNWIVLNSDSAEVPDGDGFQQTTAVQENNTVVININHLNRPAPRVVYAITKLAETFHPDAFAEETPDAGPTDTPETDTPETDTSKTDTPEAESTQAADDSGAGFGVVVVFVAVAIVAGIGGRHGDTE